MATRWMAAFKSIRWNKVLGMAPAIADSARKLWSSVAKSHSPAGTPQLLPAAKVYSSDPATAALEKQIHKLDLRADRLREDIVLSSEIIDKLAEQQSELVAAVDILRSRTRALTLACVLLAVATAALAALAGWVLLR